MSYRRKVSLPTRWGLGPRRGRGSPDFNSRGWDVSQGTRRRLLVTWICWGLSELSRTVGRRCVSTCKVSLCFRPTSSAVEASVGPSRCRVSGSHTLLGKGPSNRSHPEVCPVVRGTRPQVRGRQLGILRLVLHTSRYLRPGPLSGRR